MAGEWKAAFDAERLGREGHAAVNLLVDHYRRVRAGEGPVLAYQPPEAMVAAWGGPFPREPSPGAFAALLGRVIRGGMQLHHPRFVGHQVTSPLPDAAVAELVTALMNNGMAIYEMGPVAMAMERALVRFLAGALGFPPGADGVLTSGGSAGNLTALLAARQARAGFDAWKDGGAAGPPLAVAVCGEAHYSVKRAAQIMGWGADGVVPVAADDAYRMREDALLPAIEAAERAGRRVIGVVASAGSTATGAVDPLESIAETCGRRELWLHVDGAHGAACALGDRHRGLVAGIDRADSVVWDAHKMMLMPSLVTAVLFRDGRRSYEAFSQSASYLFDEAPPEREWWNLGTRTLECTKPTMSVPLYLALATWGTRFFGDYVDDCIDRARAFADRLVAAGDFEIATPPDLNIVCFRHVPRGRPVADLDALQAEVRARLVESGAFYLVMTRLRGKLWLRVTILNPGTTDGDLDDLAAAVRSAAA